MTRFDLLSMLDKFNRVVRYRDLPTGWVLHGPDINNLDFLGVTIAEVSRVIPDYLSSRYYYWTYVAVDTLGTSDGLLASTLRLTRIWESCRDGPFDVNPNTRFNLVFIDEKLELENWINELRSN